MTITVTPDAGRRDAAGDGAAASVVPRAGLTPDERCELFALLTQFFDGVDDAQFFRDLDEKDWVLRIRDGGGSGRLLGFTTVQVYRTSIDAAPASIVYSGDTIVAPEAWGSPVLARAWIALIRQLQTTHPSDPWYWLLLSSGFRTYRFLPVFWRDFWPRHDADPSDETAALLRRLAHERFGSAFDAVAGVVRFPRPQRLRPSLASVPDGRRDDPHIRFFLQRNPGHAAGDELVCLTRLGDDNLTAAGARMVRGARP